MRLGGAGKRRVGDHGAAVAVAGDIELPDDILTEQRDVGGVRAVAYRQRAAGVVAGLGEGQCCRAGDIRDVPQIEIVRQTKACNQPAEGDRGIKLQRAAAACGKRQWGAAGQPPLAISTSPPLIVVALAMPPEATYS